MKAHIIADLKGGQELETTLYGEELLRDPFLNKGSAFTEAEREEFGLKGLLPYNASTPEEQEERTYSNFLEKSAPIQKYIFLAGLQDRNETLFYRMLLNHITEMVPVIYTPTVGEACQKYSHIFRRAHGLYLAYPDMDAIPDILNKWQRDVSVIVVTDGQRILGLGDLGAGGMGIPVGKLSLYTVCAGIHPQKCLPILLDVGTNNEDLLKDPLYIGWKHARLSGTEYDKFIERFVQGVKARWPNAILQWEDFSKDNASRLLDKYKNTLPSFNDDIQGTAAVSVAGIIRGLKVTGRKIADEKIVILGAGSAATGIARLLTVYMKKSGIPEKEAKEKIWLIDTKGLVHQGRKDLSEDKAMFAQSLKHLGAVKLDPEKPILLEAVVPAVGATILIGTSGQPGVFGEALVRSMAIYCDRPMIFPLSNPTSKSEAVPADILEWTEGKALVATGSPFQPVLIQGKKIPIGQCNNAFIFPGVGLGLAVTKAKFVPEEVFLAAAETLAVFDKRLPGFEDSLFPNLEHVREISRLIAEHVGREIIRLGLNREPLTLQSLPDAVRSSMWEPVYPKLKLRPA